MTLSPVVKQGIVIAVAFLLFLVNGAEAVEGFLKHDLAIEILGPLGTVLSVVLGWLVSAGLVPQRLTT